MNLPDFIRENIEDILQEWENYAFKIQPDSGSMSKDELRDHAKKILFDIAAGIERNRSQKFRDERSRGMHPLSGQELKSAIEHGISRHDFGFTINDLISEYRALRRSVIRLWGKSEQGESDWNGISLFNEELDGLIKEAVEAFTVISDKQRNILERVITASRDHCYLLNGHGRFIYANSSFLKDLNIANSALLGKTPAELPINASRLLQQEAMKTLATGRENSGEVTYTLPSGENRRYEYLYEPIIEDQEKVEGVMALERDVTDSRDIQDALRRSEERWNLALENIEAGVIITNEEARVIYWNPAARKLHGLTSPDEGFGPLEETFDLWTPDRRHKLQLDERPIRRIIRGETVQGYELRLHRPDQGWEKYISYSGSVVETAEGEKLIFLTLYDLTELQNRTEELAVANRELESFSYSVSHDLRAPLHVISSMSSSLRRYAAGQIDSTANEYLLRIEAGTKKMNQLINDILRLARVGRHKMVMEEIDLSLVAKTFADELRQQQNRQVEFRIPDGMTARGDAQLLTIAMTNLLRNAWKYTSKEAEACIEVGSCEMNGKTVFFIRDSGAGFSIEQVDRLFQPFQRLHCESEFPGTGIGLPIVQRVINRHGGVIWAESEVGKGATFYFTLGS